MMSVIKQMPIIEHIEELRRRIIYILIFAFVLCTITFLYSSKLIKIINSNMPQNVQLIVTTPFEVLFAKLSISIFVSILILIPFIIYQLVKFVNPALNKKEKMYLKFVPFSIVLFFIGFYLAFFFIVKFGMTILASNAINLGIKTLWSLNDTIFFIFSLSFIFGLCLQMPLIIFALNKLNVVGYETLKKQRKYVYVFVFILSAIITPTVDPFTQTIVAIPLIVLYEITMALIKIF